MDYYITKNGRHYQYAAAQNGNFEHIGGGKFLKIPCDIEDYFEAKSKAYDPEFGLHKL